MKHRNGLLYFATSAFALLSSFVFSGGTVKTSQPGLGQPQKTDQPTLRVGVKHVPQFLSPARACTDVEKQALELVFESLLQPSYHADTGQIYEPVLAKGLPKVIANGRRFTFRSNATWSTGEKVSLADLRSTIELLKKSHHSGEGFLWSQIVKPALTGEPLVFEAQFSQPFFDPLLPFTFKVLPQPAQTNPLPSVHDSAFALAPVGSGPFALDKQNSGAKQTRFVLNKFHPQAAKSVVGEILFVPSTNPVAELGDSKSPVHVLFDLTESQIAHIKSKKAAQVKSLDNRRIYFLAVNHRKKEFQDVDLRQALAKAINREQLLNHCFRGLDPAYGVLEATGAPLGSATDFLKEKFADSHHELNGPFPAGSWAIAPKSRVPSSLFQADQAQFQFRKVKDRFQTLTLKLAYPDDDPRISHACSLLADQLEQSAAKAELALKIQLMPLSPWKLVEAVHAHEYDLAYYHWDFGSEYYWLWPLFDPNPQALDKNGSNFLGYQNDADLESLLRKRMSYHDFEALKEITHDVHAHLFDNMPLIPLWQLDVHIAVHGDLQTGPLDGSSLFAKVTDWQLKGN